MCGIIDLFLESNYRPVTTNHSCGILRFSSKTRVFIKIAKSASKKGAPIFKGTSE